MWFPAIVLCQKNSPVVQVDNPAIAYDYEIGSHIPRPAPGAIPYPAIDCDYQVGAAIPRAFAGAMVEPAIDYDYQIGVAIPKPVPELEAEPAIDYDYEVVSDVPGDTFVVFDNELDPNFVYSTVLKRSPGSKVKVESSAIADSPVIFTADANGDVAVSLKSKSNLSFLPTSHPITFKSGKGALLYKDTILIARTSEILISSPAPTSPYHFSGNYNQEIVFKLTNRSGSPILMEFQEDIGLGLAHTIYGYKESDGLYHYTAKVVNSLFASSSFNIFVSEINENNSLVAYVLDSNLNSVNNITLVNQQFDTYSSFQIKNQAPIIPNIEVDIAIKNPAGVLHKKVRTKVDNNGYFDLKEYFPLQWHTQATDPTIEITPVASSFPAGSSITATISAIAVQSLYKNTPGFSLSPFSSVTLTGYKENGVGATITSGTAYLGLDSLVFTVTGGTYGEQASLHLMAFDDPTYFKIQHVNFVRNTSATQTVEVPRLTLYYGTGSLKVLLESQSTPSLYSPELKTSSPINLVNAATISIDKETLTQDVSNTITLETVDLITSNKSISYLGTTASSGNIAGYDFIYYTNPVPINAIASTTSIVAASSDRPRTYTKAIELIDSTYRLETVTDPNYLLLNCPTPQVLRLYSRSINTVEHLITIPAALSLLGAIVTVKRYVQEPYYCVEFEIPPTAWLNVSSVQIAVKIGTVTTQFTLPTETYVKQLSVLTTSPGLPGQNLQLKGKPNQGYSLNIPFLNLISQPVTADANGDINYSLPAITGSKGTYQGSIQNTSNSRSYPLSFQVTDSLPVVIQSNSGSTLTGDFLLANSVYNYSFSVSDRNCATFQGSGLVSQAVTTVSGTVISGTFTTGSNGEIKVKSLDGFGNQYEKSYLITTGNPVASFEISYNYVSVRVTGGTVGTQWQIILKSDTTGQEYYFSGSLTMTNAPGNPEYIYVDIKKLPADKYAAVYLSPGFYYQSPASIELMTENLEPLYAQTPEQLKTIFHDVLTGLNNNLLTGNKTLYYQNGVLKRNSSLGFRSNAYYPLYALVSGAKVLNQASVTAPIVVNNNFSVQVANDGSFTSITKRTSAKVQANVSTNSTIERIFCGYDASSQLLQLDCFLTYSKAITATSTTGFANGAGAIAADVEIFFSFKYFSTIQTVKIPSSFNDAFVKSGSTTLINSYHNSAVYSVVVENIQDSFNNRTKVSLYISATLVAELLTPNNSVINFPDPMLISNKGDDKYAPNSSLKYLLVYKNPLTAADIKQHFISNYLKPKFKSPYYPFYEELKILWSGNQKNALAIEPKSVPWGGTKIADFTWESVAYPIKTDSDGLNYLDCDGTSSLYLPNTSSNFAKLNADAGTSFFASVLRGSDRAGTQIIFSMAGSQIVTLGFDQPTATLGAIFATIGGTKYRFTYPVAWENERMDIQLRPGATNATNLVFINGTRYPNNSTPFAVAATVLPSQANQHQLGGKGLPATERFKGRIYFAGITHSQPEAIINEYTNTANAGNYQYAYLNFLSNPFCVYPIFNGVTNHYSAGLVMSQEGLNKHWKLAATNFGIGNANVPAVNQYSTEYLI